jgi:mitogen-activated protein kinase 15
LGGVVCVLQPSNMLLNSDCLVKVCDFGLARSIASLTSNSASNPVCVCVCVS